ncbi:hypothetical protein SAMN05421775_101226 [Jannaschia aquimarina]|nr:hypothetical protein SAMN05421775_101226 [Jannaschia aquimarina]
MDKGQRRIRSHRGRFLARATSADRLAPSGWLRPPATSSSTCELELDAPFILPQRTWSPHRNPSGDMRDRAGRPCRRGALRTSTAQPGVAVRQSITQMQSAVCPKSGSHLRSDAHPGPLYRAGASHGGGATTYLIPYAHHALPDFSIRRRPRTDLDFARKVNRLLRPLQFFARGRREKGEGRREKGEGRREKGEGRREKGEGRREKGEGRREKGEGRRSRDALPNARHMSDRQVQSARGKSIETGFL